MKFRNYIQNIDTKIESIELYLYNINAKKSFSFGTWTSRQQSYIRIVAQGHCGYGEEVIAVNNPEVTLDEWGTTLSSLKGKTIPEAFDIVRKNINHWEDRLSEITEMALIDLSGKLLQKSALELLDFDCKNPIHGVYVILSDDPVDVEEKTKWAVANNRATFIKVKLFGDNDLDNAIVSAVRKHANKSTYLIGDVNGGYLPKNSAYVSNDVIAPQLIRLHNSGLDACEDPAYIDNQEWVKLQQMVGELALIPDYPMRPAGVIKDNFIEGMGDIYNIHPGCTGSVIDAIALAYRIRESGAKLMIGDDSLVGMGCSIWQQIAIGLSANWVEATEKEKESDLYYDMLEKMHTVTVSGKISLEEPIHGFGIYLNDEKLKENADKYYKI